MAVSFPIFASGGRDPKGEAPGNVPGAAVPRVLSAYVAADTANKQYLEGMYLPQAVAAYFPTPFSGSAKERKFEFDRGLSSRILSSASLKGDIRLYSIEVFPSASGLPSGAREDGRSYTFSFPRSALGKPGSAAVQPALYALDRAVRLSGAAKGVARLETLAYDEASGAFKASVHVAAQSIKR